MKIPDPLSCFLRLHSSLNFIYYYNFEYFHSGHIVKTNESLAEYDRTGQGQTAHVLQNLGPFLGKHRKCGQTLKNRDFLELEG